MWWSGFDSRPKQRFSLCHSLLSGSQSFFQFLSLLCISFLFVLLCKRRCNLSLTVFDVVVHGIFLCYSTRRNSQKLNMEMLKNWQVFAIKEVLKAEYTIHAHGIFATITTYRMSSDEPVHKLSFRVRVQYSV